MNKTDEMAGPAANNSSDFVSCKTSSLLLRLPLLLLLLPLRDAMRCLIRG